MLNTLDAHMTFPREAVRTRGTKLQSPVDGLLLSAVGTGVNVQAGTWHRRLRVDAGVKPLPRLGEVNFKSFNRILCDSQSLSGMTELGGNGVDRTSYLADAGRTFHITPRFILSMVSLLTPNRSAIC